MIPCHKVQQVGLLEHMVWSSRQQLRSLEWRSGFAVNVRARVVVKVKAKVVVVVM